MSEHNDMTCAELADVAAELALGVLTGRERAAALAHLDTCDACREEVRQLMATGEQLLELLPPAEPPAGFETRVLDRLGLPVPAGGSAPAKGRAELLQAGTRERQGRRRRTARGGTPASADVTRPGTSRPGGTGPGATSPGTGRTGRLRRALAASALGLAVIAAGLGGWRIGAGSPATSTAAGPLTSASLLSATHQDVGDIYLYSGNRRWLYMSVYLGSGNELVTCQIVGTDGKLTTIGSFRLASGYGGWGSPDPGTSGPVRGAQLVATDGTVLATATFAS
jgi:anti-sigma factor RsiW